MIWFPFKAPDQSLRPPITFQFLLFCFSPPTLHFYFMSPSQSPIYCTFSVLFVRGGPVFCSKSISEFFQLWPQTPSAFFRLQLPPSSGDASEAYEQMCIRLEDVCKTTFPTIFWEFLGRFVHIYLGDIFIYSQSIREHIEHTMKVLQWLRESQFYLSKSKLDLFSDMGGCL